MLSINGNDAIVGIFMIIHQESICRNGRMGYCVFCVVNNVYVTWEYSRVLYVEVVRVGR